MEHPWKSTVYREIDAASTRDPTLITLAPSVIQAIQHGTPLNWPGSVPQINWRIGHSMYLSSSIPQINWMNVFQSKTMVSGSVCNQFIDKSNMFCCNSTREQQPLKPNSMFWRLGFVNIQHVHLLNDPNVGKDTPPWWVCYCLFPTSPWFEHQSGAYRRLVYRRAPRTCLRSSKTTAAEQEAKARAWLLEKPGGFMWAMLKRFGWWCFKYIIIKPWTG